MSIAGNIRSAPAGAPPRVRPVLAQAVAAQAGGLAAALALALALREAIPVPLAAIAIVQGAAAALIAAALGQPRWWIAIHLAFLPLAVLAFPLELQAHWYLGAFALLALVFGGVHRSRVPLFLSGECAIRALIGTLPRATALRFLDLGCGTGSVLARVACERPRISCRGIESAWLPALIARWRSRGRYAVERGSFWDADLASYDVVYAYLSPAAMRRLEAKANAEMKPGTLVVSNSFAFPAAAPEGIVRWGTREGELLFIYRIR